jgi:hypothetical protein
MNIGIQESSADQMLLKLAKNSAEKVLIERQYQKIRTEKIKITLSLHNLPKNGLVNLEIIPGIINMLDVTVAKQYLEKELNMLEMKCDSLETEISRISKIVDQVPDWIRSASTPPPF